MFFERATEKIHAHRLGRGRALVHCMAGVSRSASICIAYLMRFCDMSLREAFYFLRDKRCVVRPNVGFWRQLIEYEKKLYGQQTVFMQPTMNGMLAGEWEFS